MDKKLQCKDIPEIPILQYLKDSGPGFTCIWYGFNYNPDTRDLYCAFPVGTPPKLAHAKLRNMYFNKLITGCICGCRGDFELTDKGRRKLEATYQKIENAPVVGN